MAPKWTMVTDTRHYLADGETPVSLYQRWATEKNSFIFESMESDGSRGRYSIIGIRPLLHFSHTQGISTVVDCLDQSTQTWNGDPFTHLRTLLTHYQFPRTKVFETGFLSGYIGYDAIRYIEKLPDTKPESLTMPEIQLLMPSEVYIVDNFTSTVTHVMHRREGRHHEVDAGQTIVKDAFKDGVQHDDCSQDNESAAYRAKKDRQEGQLVPLPESHGELYEGDVNVDDADFAEQVRQAKTYISEGDIFQVVLSRRFSRPVSAKAFDIYRMLRLVNPSPYMYYMVFDGVEIVGSSPETQVKIENDEVTVFPIAGTRPRGRNAQEDTALEAELRRDVKENAEHVMLVDLGRNDVGRISTYGSVEVVRFRDVERFSHVMHLVSLVRGRIRDNVDAIDVFRACFPAGTISGAPKIRAMAIIDELELMRRGLYSGAVGYFDCCGRSDTCIAIRTLWVQNKVAYWQAGAGIVADSDPQAEADETRSKARALAKAIALAEEL